MCDVEKTLGGVGTTPPLPLVARRLNKCLQYTTDSPRYQLIYLCLTSLDVISLMSKVTHRVARCPVFDQRVRYFGSLSGIKMKVMPDNACVRYFQALGILRFSYNL